MAAALLATGHFHHHFGRAAYNPRKLGARAFRIGNPETGIERRAGHRIGIMDIADTKRRPGRFPQGRFQAHQSATAQ
ncbi:hypothetical protein [Sphingomonas sp. 10B4]|uniref:hypothetical protein n=1 Tax=Sphingomonas sp. 10B4 TaxID=3048575 RepID=UPI002AB37060|nr:hypothetical protein [Sphingomonas sp. 10B4]MDY7522819.1 hypothetical protein [Sphingomonas sp. 10B4]